MDTPKRPPARPVLWGFDPELLPILFLYVGVAITSAWAAVPLLVSQGRILCKCIDGPGGSRLAYVAINEAVFIAFAVLSVWLRWLIAGRL